MHFVTSFESYKPTYGTMTKAITAIDGLDVKVEEGRCKIITF
jgi:hypothetical protein